MSEIILYQNQDNKTELEVKFDGDTVWLNQAQLILLFQSSKANISEHLKGIFKSAELETDSTVRKFRTVRQEGKRMVSREIEHYNLDVIISLGYKVNTKRGIQFRQWATQRLKDYLVEGFAINQKRLAENQMQVQYLKTGIRILSRAIHQQSSKEDSEMLQLFAKGLALLDDYDHEHLDLKGNTIKEAYYPSVEQYLTLITQMRSDFSSDVFAKPKDSSFESSVLQIAQSFDGYDLYETIEEKAVVLLYLIVKNHSFVDGNKRIGAACFLYFLERNNMLYISDQTLIIENETLAAITLFVATSKPEEMETVKQLIISILNRR